MLILLLSCWTADIKNPLTCRDIASSDVISLAEETSIALEWNTLNEPGLTPETISFGAEVMALYRCQDWSGVSSPSMDVLEASFLVESDGWLSGLVLEGTAVVEGDRFRLLAEQTFYADLLQGEANLLVEVRGGGDHVTLSAWDESCGCMRVIATHTTP